MFLFRFILYGTIWASWIGQLFSFPFEGVYSYYLLKYFLRPFPFVFFFQHTYDSNVRCLILSKISLRLSPFLIFYPLCFTYFHHAVFKLTYPIFCFSYCSVGCLQSVLNLSYCIVHYCETILYFFQALSKHFCIFSIHASSPFFCISILFSRIWNIFVNIILNYFQVDSLFPLLCGLMCLYHVPSPAGQFSAFSLDLVCCV